MKSRFPGFIFSKALLFGALATMAGAAPQASSCADLSAPIKWVSSEPLISPVSDAKHAIVSIKDPTVVRHNGLWHVYATVANKAHEWSMVYLNFSDWSEAGKAKQVYLEVANPGFKGYHCAPQIFYFRPQKKWYLIYQSQPPTYSTTDDITKPETWTAPAYFYKAEPKGVPKLWIDYWVICDDKDAYMFSSGDDGRWYRCKTSLKDFPNGFSAPEVILEMPTPGELFEASCVYRLKDTGKYLGIIECIGKQGNRYFKSFVADSLGGKWVPLHASEENPFAGLANVAGGYTPALWTRDISHGELLRDGCDETLTVDPARLELLYQGLPSDAPRNLEYSQLPYKLGLLRRVSATK